MKSAILLILTVTCIAWSSCNDSQTDKYVRQSRQLLPADTSKSGRFDNNVNRKMLEGYWSLEGGNNVTFVIEKDSIWYPDNSERFKYFFAGDFLIVNYGDRLDTLSYKIRCNDTLITSSKLGMSTFVRFRQ